MRLLRDIYYCVPHISYMSFAVTYNATLLFERFPVYQACSGDVFSWQRGVSEQNAAFVFAHKRPTPSQRSAHKRTRKQPTPRATQ